MGAAGASASKPMVSPVAGFLAVLDIELWLLLA